MSEHGSPEAPAGSPKLPEAKPEAKPGAIEIKVKDQNEGEMFFKIKSKTKMGKVFDAYCERQGLVQDTIRFLFEGARILKEDTPESLEMENGDMIQAMIQQVGGDGGGALGADYEVKPEDLKVNEYISINVKDQAGQEVVSRIKRSTQLKKVFTTYCKRQEIDPKLVRFLFDGERVQDDDTPISRDMEDEDVLDVFAEQIGGGGGGAGEEPAAYTDGAEGGESKPKPPQIAIKVKDTHGNSVDFKCKLTTPLNKLIVAYCQSKERKPDSLRFFTPDGKRITGGDTPLSLEMEDGDVIDVHEEQQGGSYNFFLPAASPL